MEPISAALLAEKVAEAVAVQEVEIASEIGKLSSEVIEGQMNEQTIQTLNELLDQDKYRKLAEYRELSQTNPEVLRSAYNDIHLKGQMGESIMEATLSQHGEVQSQVAVQLEGASSANRVDLQLVESNSNLKQLELTVEDGQAVLESNYDVVKGDSASYEVKNGGLQYLRQELTSGELQQQIAAGKEISDHSFAVINVDTAKALMENPVVADQVVKSIQDSGGKLLVGLPDTSYQMAIFIS